MNRTVLQLTILELVPFKAQLAPFTTVQTDRTYIRKEQKLARQSDISAKVDTEGEWSNK